METGNSRKVARASHSPVVSNTTVIPTIIKSTAKVMSVVVSRQESTEASAMVMSVVGSKQESTGAGNTAYQGYQQTLVAWQCHS